MTLNKKEEKHIEKGKADFVSTLEAAKTEALTLKAKIRALEKIRDFVDKGLEELRKQADLLPFPIEDFIEWESHLGGNGLYETAEPTNAFEYRQLHKALVRFKGRFRKQPFFYWMYRDGLTIGRKKIDECRLKKRKRSVDHLGM